MRQFKERIRKDFGKQAADDVIMANFEKYRKQLHKKTGAENYGEMKMQFGEFKLNSSRAKQG
jgi:hypothetical protein